MGSRCAPPDVNYSDWDNTLEPVGTRRFAVRLGLRQIDGMSARWPADRMTSARDRCPLPSLHDLKTRAGIDAGTIRRLAAADAVRSMALDRRQALWDARALRDAPDLPLFRFRHTGRGRRRPVVTLPQMPACEHVVADYQTLRLSLKAHPMSFLRRSMARQGYTPRATCPGCATGDASQLAGIVLIRQRPGSAKGVCFITLEDETGVANLVVWPKVMAQYRKVIMASRLIDVKGYVQRDADVIHIVAQHLEDRSDALHRLSNDPQEVQAARKDHGIHPSPTSSHRHPRNVRIIPKSRDFH